MIAAPGPLKSRQSASLSTALIVMVGAVAAATAWGRLPSAARKTLWAEDGATFIGDVQRQGFLRPLFLPYQGYQQLAPRVVADLVAAIFPPHLYAIAMTAAACLLTGAVSALIFALSAQIVRYVPARIGLALLPVVSGSAVAEVLGNMANFHSVVMCLGPWLFLFRPRTRLQTVLLAVVATAATLTEIQLILFLPLALVRPYSWRRAWVAFAALLAGGIGLVSYLLAPRDGFVHGVFSLRSNVYGYLANAILGTLSSSRSTIGSLMASHPWVPAAACVPIAAAFVLVMWRGTGDARAVTISLAVASLGVWLIGFNLNNAAAQNDFALYTAEQWRGLDHVLRYGIVPGVLAFSIPLVALDLLPCTRVGRTIAATMVTIGLVVAITQFAPENVRRTGYPEWSVPTSASGCASVDGVPLVQVPEAPSGWTVPIDCARLP